MKLNKILMAFAAVAMVGCSSEDVMDFSANQAPEDSRMIQLDENFALAGVGAEDGVTRTHWDLDGEGNVVNQFLPIYAIDGAANAFLYKAGVNEIADLEAQTVGLCWLGQGAVGTDVYTNYQFYHFGWLNDGETEAEFECNALTNGALYDEITLKAAVTAGNEAVPANDFTLPAKSVGGLNYNSGIYKTDNKAIFGGQYIVYYPFNENFINAGTIPALAVTQFGDGDVTSAPKVLTAPELGLATFRYSAPVTIEGGDQAAGFGLKNLSTLVQLKIFTPDGDANIGDNIDKIILYSESGKLLKQANLAADKIVAGQKGEALYAETEGTKTITANFKTGEEIVLAKEDDAAAGAFITVLPTTVDDLKILLHNSTDKTWATIDKAGTTFGAGKAKQIKVSVAAADFKSDFIAVDDASLRTALSNANDAVIADATATPTITIIGDITLTSNLDMFTSYNKCESFTITGDAIIVPQDVTLKVRTNIESDINILGKSCCTGNKGGMLYVQGGTISNVTMVPTEVKKELTPSEYNNYNPFLYYTAAGNSTATVAAGKTIDVKAGRVSVEKAVEHKGNIVIAKGAKLNVVANKGDINFMGSTVENNGTIEVKKGGKFDMTDADGNATAADGQRMTNNGTFIHNVDAGVGTAVQSMVQNGEYRCRVNAQIKLNDAYQQWTACSVIEMVDAGVSYDFVNVKKHNDKHVDIEVNTTSETTFDNDSKDNKTIQIGNLTVKDGGLKITFTNSKSRTLTVNGDMTAEANTEITSSQKINVTGNLIVNGATLTYKGNKANKDGFAVTGDVNVTNGTFDADEVDAINITCANFTLADGAIAKFGNRKEGNTKNMTVDGTISNPVGCKFLIHTANQEGASVLAWITCTQLKVGGTFSAARPIVVAAE